MNHCVPFIGVPDIAATIAFYESIGFTCTATNHKWEPECELNWAELVIKNAYFMLFPSGTGDHTPQKYVCLYFSFDSIEGMLALLEGKAEIIEVTDRTFYGRKEIIFKDLNGLQVTFSSEPDPN